MNREKKKYYFTIKQIGKHVNNNSRDIYIFLSFLALAIDLCFG